MSLWIRSQDKKGLLEVNNIYADEGRIISIAKTGGRVTVGSYLTQKRALELLNEIQKAVLAAGAEHQDITKLALKGWFATNINTGIAIYEMPNE